MDVSSVERIKRKETPMENKIIINCEKCKKNVLAKIISQDYQIGIHFKQSIQCMDCNHIHQLHIDLRRENSEDS